MRKGGKKEKRKVRQSKRNIYILYETQLTETRTNRNLVARTITNVSQFKCLPRDPQGNAFEEVVDTEGKNNQEPTSCSLDKKLM